MSSVHYLREFVADRLTAAASEIFSEFEKTILRYEEVIDRQRRLLDVSWRPEPKQLNGVDLGQEPTDETELNLTDKQLCGQERNPSLDQEEPEAQPLQNQDEQEELEAITIKEEEQELCINQEEDQLHPNQEPDQFMVTVMYGESDHSEAEPDGEQLISQSSAGPEDQDSGSNENTEWSPKKTRHTDRCHGNKTDQSATSASFSCKICDEAFAENSHLGRHIEVHTVRGQNSDKLQYCCPTCGRKFPSYSKLVIHVRTHTGEKAFSCRVCGKKFSTKSNSQIHMRIHTGERPFVCQTCGKSFNHASHLYRHMKVHTGEKPFSCKTCGKSFNQTSNLNIHMKVHTG